MPHFDFERSKCGCRRFESASAEIQSAKCEITTLEAIFRPQAKYSIFGLISPIGDAEPNLVVSDCVDGPNDVKVDSVRTLNTLNFDRRPSSHFHDES